MPEISQWSYRISLRSSYLQKKLDRGPGEEIRRGLFECQRRFGQSIWESKTVLGEGLPRTAESAVREDVSEIE
jgi:hypothetical protein